MIQKQTILKALPHVLRGIDIPNLGKKFSGKVRDFYILSDKRIIITTDRQSAFDVILGCIPYKGAVLNQLAAFWFEHTKHIVPNHMIAVPDPNVLIAHNCEPIPVEMIVRGYISGVTKTSIWYSYEKGERFIYGQQFPDGLRKNQKLIKPVITPTTHPEAGSVMHDERLTREEIIKRKIVSEKLYKQMEETALALFDYGSKLCKKQGLILVDTKYEFGLYKGKLMLIDEIHTPDSSRFWIASTYKKRFSKGGEPDNFDKEFLRLWYSKKGYTGEGKPPKMSKELVVDLSKRYISVYEKITGKKFEEFVYPVGKRIMANLQKVKQVDSKDSERITYKSTGVDYDVMDPLKRLAQFHGKQTVKNLTGTTFKEVSESRGESAYVMAQTGGGYLAFVEEGLGTKSLVADAMTKITGKTYYDQLAQDTVAAIVNDIITVGAKPTTILAYWAAGSSDWFRNKKRMDDLVKGWRYACDMSGAVWGGGETPTLSGIIENDAIDLGGACFGIIENKQRLVLGKKLAHGDTIILLESSGIHANGLSLARKIATKLPFGYKTKIFDKTMYGESLLIPTIIYAKLIQDIFSKGVDIHYMANITGHGWRKLMRHTTPFTYRIKEVPPVPPVLKFIVEKALLDLKEAYSNLNMGAGFALFVPQKDVKKVLQVTKKHNVKAYTTGIVEKGPKQVVIEPLDITLKGDSLNLR